MPTDPTRGLTILCALAAVLAAGCDRDAGNAVSVRPLEVTAAPGSLGPHLAAGSDGALVLSWVEPQDGGHVLRHARLSGSGWGEAQAVAAGDDWFVNWADFASVVPLSQDLWAAHWLVRQPPGGYAYDIVVSLSSDGGASWSEPVRPHDDGTPTEHGFVTLFPRGDGAGLVWLDGRHMADADYSSGTTGAGMSLRAATVTRGLSIANPEEIDGLTCDCCQTDVAPTPKGAVAVYRDRSEGEIRDIAAARLTRAGWQPLGTVADDGWQINGCPVNGPVIAADGERLAVAWFTGAGDAPRIRLARSTDSGSTWSEPVDVAKGELAGHAGVALLEGDRVAVTWVCERPGGNGVCLRSVSPGGELGALQMLSGDARVPAFSVPQVARHADRLVLAWTEESGDSTRIGSASLAIDALP